MSTTPSFHLWLIIHTHTHTHKVETHKNKERVPQLTWIPTKGRKLSGKQKWIKTLVLVRVMGEVPQSCSKLVANWFWNVLIFLASKFLDLKGLKDNIMCIPMIMTMLFKTKNQPFLVVSNGFNRLSDKFELPCKLAKLEFNPFSRTHRTPTILTWFDGITKSICLCRQSKLMSPSTL